MHFMTTIGIILLVAYEIKKDSMTRAERRAYNVCWRNKRIKILNNESFLNISNWR